MAGRKRRPAISFRQDTYDRLAYAAHFEKCSRGALAEKVLREHLDSIGIPLHPPRISEHPLLERTADDERIGGVHFL